METLANKYRPKILEDVVGQDGVTLVLKKQLETGNIKNCYLFTGPAGCVDRDTEFFSQDGWKKICDYVDGDKVLQYNEHGKAEFVTPINYIKNKATSLWQFKTKYGINQCLSDEHNVYYVNSCGDLVSDKFKNIRERHETLHSGFSGKFLSTFSYGGPGIGLTNAEIKLMCAVICDGSFINSSSNKNRCRFHIKKTRKKNRLRELFNECGLQYKESVSSAPGYVDFYVDAPIKTKVFDKYWYNCSHSQLEIICSNVLFWDGNESANGKKRFSTTIKQTADFIQFAFTSCGYRATISTGNRQGKTLISNGKEYIRKSVDYTVTISTRVLTGMTSNKPENKPKIEAYKPIDGYEYCFTVPSHMWVMRRGDRIVITGNCGKTSLARIIANSVNSNLAPIEIDAASNNGVDNVRDLIVDCQMKPLTGKYKTYIIDECHMLSNSAWNAFLKVLEEPPTNVIFILCTTDPQKIPNTILSRVQRFDLKRIDINGLVSRLDKVLKQESITNTRLSWDRDSLEYIAKVANGGMRTALSYLDKCVGYSENLTSESVSNSLGLDDYANYFKLLNHITDYEDNESINLIETLFESGVDLKQFIKGFTQFLLDINKYSLTQGLQYTMIPKYCEPLLKDYINSVDIKFVKDLMKKFVELYSTLRWETNIKDIIEMQLILLCEK